MHYLLTGGTGFIGSNFLKFFVGQGDQATILSRGSHRDRNNVRFVQDLSEIDKTTKFDYVINLAGKPIDCLWTSKNKQQLIDSRVSVTKSLVEFLAGLDNKPKMMISASAIGFYGNYGDKEIDESSSGKQSFTNELCQKWETEALKAKEHDIKVCIMRFGVVLGQGGGFIKKISIPFKLALGGKIGSGKQHFSWIHIEDVMMAMKHVMQMKDGFGIYNLVAPELITNEDFTKNIGLALNRPTICTVPEFIIKLFFGEMGENLLLNGNKIIPQNLKKAGYKFKYTKSQSALKEIFG